MGAGCRNVLTKKQYSLLMLIHQQLQQGGVSPSFAELREGMGLRSKSSVHQLVCALEERGYIRRLPHRARAMEVIRLPAHAASDNLLAPSDCADSLSGEASKAIQFEIFTQNFRTQFNQSDTPDNANLPGSVCKNVPFLGKLTSDMSVAALARHASMFAVPNAMLGDQEHDAYCAVQIDDDSMAELGIFSHDIAVLQKTDQAKNGAIVLAVINGEKIVFKRFQQRADKIALHSANKFYETHIYHASQIKIEGKLCALIRQY
ncbi:MAG: transcriptional repressor LexA [Pseudomonadota bacterium]